MFDEKKRREELKDIISNYPFEVNKYDKIIHDEKSMITEAVKEFAEKINKFCWHSECNRLLKEYGINIDEEKEGE
jgi:hypothetical protein